MVRTITNKIDAITHIPDIYRCEAPPIPKSCKIEITPFCNLKCWFCATNKGLRKKTGDMKWEFYTRIVKEMRELGVEELGVFYLGESFLCQWLSDAIAYAKEDCKYPYVFLTTNGVISTPEKVEACMKAGLNSLKFSFNHADEEQFKETTKTPGKGFYKILENMKEAYRIREEGNYDCGLFASSIRFNGEQMVKMEKTINEILPYVDEHYYLPLYSQGDLIQVKEGNQVLAGNPGRLNNLTEPLPCFAIFSELHISFNGSMSLCCFDHDAKWSAGNLNEVSLIEAWHSDFAKSLRKAHLCKNVKDTVCEGCIAYK